jgi:imidazolonepropionase-like amidohydrolase
MTITLKGKWLLDGRGSDPKPDQVVVIDGKRIAAVGPKNEVVFTKETKLIDLGDGTLLPGLIDVHAHPTYFFRRPDAFEFGHTTFNEALTSLFGVWQLQKDLNAGITTVRDMGAVNRLSVDIERARQSGFVQVPRICACGKLIVPTGGHVHNRAGLAHEADGIDGVRVAVREEIKAGADFIKLATNGADFLDPEIAHNAKSIDRVFNGIEFSQEEVDAAVTEAHRAGRKLACHTRWRPAVVKAIKAGADTIEHGTFMADDDMRAIADKGIAWVPTTYQGIALNRIRENDEKGKTTDYGKDGALSRESVARRRHLFGLAVKFGVKIGAGTDIFRPEINFAALVDELQSLVDFGMAPADAVQVGTRINAEIIGWADRIGTIEPGKFADLIFVRGNPNRDICALREPKFVMADGQVVLHER